ncbi:MAG TPA: hypothetical protein VFW98_17970 [Gemmatimonadaceae bacterium]|nr:hypothetical protein [Gemmatimonadaceae bacterium]
MPRFFWAELGAGATVPDSAQFVTKFSRVYRAAFIGSKSPIINGKHAIWSGRRMIYGGAGVNWLGGWGSPALVARDGTIHLVFSEEGPTIVYMRIARDVRHVTEFGGGLGGISPTLAFGPASALYLAYIAPVRDTPKLNANSVFFRRSPDDGATWEPPVLVSRSGTREAHLVRMAVTPSGAIHLTWLKNLSGGYRDEVVWHTLSTDEGRTWSTPRELRVAGSIPQESAVAADSIGGVHAVFIFTGHGGPRLYYVRWHGMTASTPCVLDSGYNVLDPAMATDERGQVQVIWNRLLHAGHGAVREMAMHATFTPPAASGK